MAERPSFRIIPGFAPDQRMQAAQLFWEAFRGKLITVMQPEEKALQFIESVADPSHAIGAVAPDGALIGIAGFKTDRGAFIGGGFKEMRHAYGWLGGVWRGLTLSLLERPHERDTLTMDGVMVSADARGQGVGTALLCAIKARAAELRCTRVRLDVIDANPRARALYERQGFVAHAESDLGPLRRVFGFRRATTMVFSL